MIKQLGQASSADIKAVLATREKTEPEADLSADVVARLEEQIQAGMNQWVFRRYCRKHLSMTPTEIRHKLHQQIDQLPLDLLLLAADFLDFLKFKRAKVTDSVS